MNAKKTLLPTLGAAVFATAANAQVMTEVRISTAGVDQEYVEIFGNAGQSTDGLMILVVEGDPGGSTGGEGFLDRAFDVSGGMFADNYYVVGSVEASTAFPGEIDDDSNGDNMFENSSMTLYLVNVPDAAKRAEILVPMSSGGTWLENDIRDPAGSTTTRIASDPDVTILDAVAIWDGDMGDVFFDGAPVFGPDGSFLPSGVFRPGGCPSDWCTDEFVNFGTDGVTDPGYSDPSPGADNDMSATCMTTPSAGTCGSGPTDIGTNYCMANANSTGVAAEQSATGSIIAANNDVTLTASNLPTNAFGFFLCSQDQGFVANPAGSAGNLCLAGSIGRYVGPGQIQNSGGMGSFDLVIDLTMTPQPMGFVSIAAGETWNFQTWFRDSVGGMATSNFTNGLEVDFI